ncbi:MAG: hypothetical protein M3O36_02535 [Myxococcota bacterium]|nr:hypothetical protein [Myxococcota bacterium]
MAEFSRDRTHWLCKLSPDEWIRAALTEVQRAASAFEHGNARAGSVGVKRAAGMALNAALIAEPNESWGRTYLEHLEGLVRADGIPEAVRAACRVVLSAGAPSGDVVVLRTPRAHEPVLEAARDVIAHAWAVAKRHENTDG